MIEGDRFLTKVLGVKVTPRFQFGPDVYLAEKPFWWDLTTQKQWGKHLKKYTPTHGNGTFIGYGR
jgi:hypothetical protein